MSCCDFDNDIYDNKIKKLENNLKNFEKEQNKTNAEIYTLLKQSGVDLSQYYALNEEDYTKTLTSEDDVNTLEPGTYKIVKTDMPQNAPTGVVSTEYDGTLILSNSYALLFENGSDTDIFEVYYHTKTSEDSWTEWKKLAFMSDIPSLAGYATEEWVNQQIQDITGGSVTADWVKSNFLAINSSVYTHITEPTDITTLYNPGVYYCDANTLTQNAGIPKECVSKTTSLIVYHCYMYRRFILQDCSTNSLYVISGNATSYYKIASEKDIPSLSGYATQAWVQSQNYLTEIPGDYATNTEVSQAIAAALVGYATQAWVNEQISEITGGAVTSEVVSQMISDAIVGYATQTWVKGRGYQTAAQVASAITAALTGYATESYTKENFLSLNQKSYTVIEKNKDLNNYQTKGSYYALDRNTTATLANLPKGLIYGFKLTVEDLTNNNYVCQKITENMTGNTYIRTFEGQYGWHEWVTHGTVSVFNAFNQLGITSLPCTTLDVYKAIPVNSIAILGTDTTNGISDLPASSGVLEITKLSSSYRYKITFYKSSGGDTPPSKDIWVATVNNGLTQLTWEKVALMTDLTSLNNYASQEWVQQQGYQTVQQVNSLIDNATADMLTQEDLDTLNYATENWVLQTALTGYAKTTIDDSLATRPSQEFDRFMIRSTDYHGVNAVSGAEGYLVMHMAVDPDSPTKFIRSSGIVANNKYVNTFSTSDESSVGLSTNNEGTVTVVGMSNNAKQMFILVKPDNME